MTNKQTAFMDILIGATIHIKEHYGKDGHSEWCKLIDPIYDKCDDHNLEEIDRVHNKCVDITNEWIEEQKNKVLNSQLV